MLTEHLGNIAHISIPLFDVRKREFVACTNVVKLFNYSVVHSKVEIALWGSHGELWRQDNHDWVLHADLWNHNWSFENQTICLDLLARELCHTLNDMFRQKMVKSLLTESLN